MTISLNGSTRQPDHRVTITGTLDDLDAIDEAAARAERIELVTELLVEFQRGAATPPSDGGLEALSVMLVEQLTALRVQLQGLTALRGAALQPPKGRESRK